MSSEFSWPETFSLLLSGGNLPVEQAAWAMNAIVSGSVTDAELAAFLVALRAKGETVDEIIGFRDAVLANALDLQVSDHALDIVGTGGDQHKTINISSAAAIVCASVGVPVLKHGNRAASSVSGSSDVLTELGVNLGLSPEQVASVHSEIGLSFVYASLFHPGFRHASTVRAQLGIPTVFNILGPLCNPGRPLASAVGVASLERVPLVVGVFQRREANALVFRGDNGLDELSTCGHSRIWEISRGEVREHDLNPKDLGLSLATLDDIRGGNPAENAEAIRRVFQGEKGPARDIIALNAAAGIVAFDLIEKGFSSGLTLVDRLSGALVHVENALDSGAATSKLNDWVALSQSFNSTMTN